MSDLQAFLSEYVKRATDGTVDVQGTHMQFTQDLHAFIQAEKSDNEVIAQAVAKAWRDRPGQKTLAMQALIHYAMENLKVEPVNYSVIKDRVHAYIRNNTKLFKIGKGKGGGVSLVEVEGANAQAAATSTPPKSGTIQPKTAPSS
jgi:hypothetical protein